MATKDFSEIFGFVKPVESHQINLEKVSGDDCMYQRFLIHSDKKPLTGKEKFEMALVGVPSHNSNSEQANETTYNIRKELYNLKSHMPNMIVADFGDVIMGENPKDAFYAIREISTILLRFKIRLVLFGGSQDCTVGNLWAFREFESDVNLVSIDQKPDLDEMKIEINDDNWLNIAFHDSQSYLYNASLIGYQTYLSSKDELNRFSKAYFDHYKLGKVRQNIESIEPVLRDADLVSFDMAALRYIDAPGQKNASPNGLYSEEACQLSRYAGLSDRLHSFGLFGYEPGNDEKNHTAKLIAQILWYFMEGHFNRKHDYPETSLEEYTKYVVALDEIDFPIVFYNSSKSDRWWIEIETSQSENEENNEKLVCSCTFDDYKSACSNEIPEKWWNNFKKLR